VRIVNRELVKLKGRLQQYFDEQSFHQLPPTDEKGRAIVRYVTGIWADWERLTRAAIDEAQSPEDWEFIGPVCLYTQRTAMHIDALNLYVESAVV